MDTDTFHALGLDRSLVDDDPAIVINGHDHAEGRNFLNVPGDAPYHLCPEALEDVPQGEVRVYADWRATRVYAGTKRALWIVLPPGFDPAGPAPGLLFFNDGNAYRATSSYLGAVRAPRVMATLHARGEIGPMVGVFVDPGRPVEPAASKEDAAVRANRQRSLEYDSLGDRFARFVHEDVLPFVEAEIGCALSSDPARRIACGISSGGICAFTLAWHRPDSFGGVLSHCGSFTGIRGGHNYPYLVRATPRKPIRVFLQDGAGDIENLYGSWPDANRALAKSLAFAGYDQHLEFGTGGHNLRHGGALFADSLRWLLRPAR